jgi:hypothetical protein
MHRRGEMRAFDTLRIDYEALKRRHKPLVPAVIKRRKKQGEKRNENRATKPHARRNQRLFWAGTKQQQDNTSHLSVNNDSS